MALETMKTFDPKDKTFVFVDDSTNSLTFKIQDGPVLLNGVNGCQVDMLIVVAKHMLTGLNKQVPHPDNQEAIDRLDAALSFLHRRTLDRTKRGVEGTNDI